MPDYGSDIESSLGLDPSFALVTGRRAVAQALVRRYGTPRGGLFYDPEYGFDLRLFVNSNVTEAMLFQISSGAEAEAVKDQRVLSCSVSAAFDAPTETLRVTVSAVSQFGPFSLVLGIDSATVAIIEGP